LLPGLPPLIRAEKYRVPKPRQRTDAPPRMMFHVKHYSMF
jgi:hypothetical protein